MASDSQENTATRWFKARLNSPAYLAEAKQKSKHSVEEYPEVKIGPGHKTTSFLPIQQSDEMKPLLLDIGRYGLLYAYEKNRRHCIPANKLEKYKCKKTQSPKTVIIVGGGPAGLSAAYELKRAGHRVVILEKQHRVGGRVKTIGDSHFYKGMWSDSGAMRLPGTGEPDQPSTDACHFMVDFYAGKEKFNIKKKPFINECKFGYYKFYGENQIRMNEWELDPHIYSNRFWPGWDKTICKTPNEIRGIGDYYDATVYPLILQLHNNIKKKEKCGKDPTPSATAWSDWVEKWARFSFNNFVTSTVSEIKLKLKQAPSVYSDEEDAATLKQLEKLLPWPIEAVVAYTTFSYTENMDQSLVELLRDDIGQWWKTPMHTFEGGLQMLPMNFLKYDKYGGFEGDDMDLSKCVVFGATAKFIDCKDSSSVVVRYSDEAGRYHKYEGDAVIVTLPIHIIRQLKFTPPLPFDYYAALENINYGPSTKILLQCRERFWEREGINGGFSKTNMPIGQLHYPSNPDFETPSTERGILMCYTWKQEALLFGSQSPKDAIAEAVKEIEEIHPKIREYFEVGAVQAWYRDPASQGAYGLLKPMQYLAMETLIDCDKSDSLIYFAGEALSNTNGWIQGALESGLRAAFQFFSQNEKKAASK